MRLFVPAHHPAYGARPSLLASAVAGVHCAAEATKRTVVYDILGLGTLLELTYHTRFREHLALCLDSGVHYPR